MDIVSADIPSIVFKYLQPELDKTYPLNGRALSVLKEIDGKTTIEMIARKIGLNMTSMRAVISQLMELDLIEAEEEATSVVDNDFISFLNTQLSLAVGPIAQLLIEDAVTDLGLKLTFFPSHRAAELVNLLAEEIQREDKKIDFKQNMINKITEKKY